MPEFTMMPAVLQARRSDEMRGLNVKGLRGGGFGDEDISALEEAYEKLLAAATRRPSQRSWNHSMCKNGLNPHVKHMVEFLRQRDLGRHGRFQQGMRAR